MKIILSRKGFDSASGKQPNPIMPNDQLLSLPIPDDCGNNTFASLRWGNMSYLDIIQSLNPNTKLNAESLCHLDPDLRADVKGRLPNWKPAFGQAGSALSHLCNNKVGVGDLFLFFGWFQKADYIDGVLRYVKSAPDQHVIYGYMQVSEVVKSFENVPAWLRAHPHVSDDKKRGDKNAIFLPQENLSFMPNKKGCDVLDYRPNRVLTKDGMSRGCWDLPQCFKNVSITYHPHPWKDGYFKSAGRGQEFVIEATPEIIEWVKQIIQ